MHRLRAVLEADVEDAGPHLCLHERKQIVIRLHGHGLGASLAQRDIAGPFNHDGREGGAGPALGPNNH